MKLKKIIQLSIILYSLIFPLTVMADPLEINSTEYEIISGDGVEICSSDYIEYHYRVVDGKLQYRRWNATRGYWIDATWLDMPSA